MAITAEQLQALIVTEVGDTEEGDVAANVALWWEFRDSIPNLRLRYFYVKDAAIQLLMGTVREQIDETGLQGVSSKLEGKMRNLEKMLAANTRAKDEFIDLVGAGAAAGGAYGYIEQLAPIYPPVEGQLDGNDRAYRGDLYADTRQRQNHAD